MSLSGGAVEQVKDWGCQRRDLCKDEASGRRCEYDWGCGRGGGQGQVSTEGKTSEKKIKIREYIKK